MSLSARLIISFLIIALLVAVVGLINSWATDQAIGAFNQVINQNAPAISALGQIKAAAVKIHQEASSARLLRSTSAAEPAQTIDVAAESARIEAARADFDRWVSRYLAAIDVSKKQQLGQDISAAGQEVYKVSQNLIALEPDVPLEEIIAHKKKLEETEAALLATIEQAAELEFNAFEAGRLEALGNARLARTITMANIFLVGLLAAALAFVNRRTIAAPITEIRAAAQKIGQGDLDTRLTWQSNDDLGLIAQTFNQIVAEFGQTVLSKIYLHNIIYSMADTLLVVNQAGMIQLVNQAALALLGYQKNELIGQPLQKILAEEETFAQKHVTEGIKAEKTITTETYYLTKENQKIPVLFSGADLPDGQGIVCAAQDITVRKRTQQALAESQARLRTVVTNTPTILFVLDKDGIFTLSEGKGLRQLGLRTGQIVSLSAFELYEDNPIMIKNIRRVLAGEERTWVAKINDLFYETRAAPLRDQADHLIGLIGVATDITERKKIEEALRQAKDELELRVEERTAELVKTNEVLTREISQRRRAEKAVTITVQRYRSLIENSADMVAILDADGFFRYVSSSAEKILGYTSPNIIGKHFFELIHPDDVTSIQQVFWRKLHEPEALVDLETSMLHQNGSWRVLSGTGKNLLQDAVIDGLLINVHDITERKRAEEALTVARDQALEANRLKGELLARVSHELRTPLHAILGYSDMLKEGVRGPLSGGQLQLIERIMINSDKLASLIGNLLDQAQMEEGKIHLRRSTFTPQELMDQLESVLGPQAQEKGLQLITKLEPELPDRLYSDFSRLQDILINLVGNGIKFTEQGQVKVSLYCPDQAHWAIQVSDTGAGIPSKAQPHIFEPFNQVDGSITRVQGGVGLGLSIVQRLVTLLEGEITLHSELGQGSTFTITLPLTPIQEAINE